MTDLAQPGHNEAPDAGTLEAGRLEKDYAEIANSVDSALAEARQLPKVIDDDESMFAAGRIIKSLRDLTDRLESHHKKEKQPHLRAGQAVDSFFFKLWEKCAKRQKEGKPGAADILQSRINDYNNRKLEAERQARAEAERKAREQADQAAARQRAEERAAAEAAAAAERARKAENIERHEVASVRHSEQAEIARVDSLIAADKHREAQVAAGAKPADMVRARAPDVMVTMKKVPRVIITDADQLDMAKLWPFIKEEHKLMALKAWAKVTEHKRQMTGATIEMVDESVVL